MAEPIRVLVVDDQELVRGGLRRILQTTDDIDIVAECEDGDEVPDAVRKSMELWIGCVAGALEEQEFLALLHEAGFENPSIEPTRIYETEDAAAFLLGTGLDAAAIAPQIEGRFMSAFVRATKPLHLASLPVAESSKSCCGPECCA